MRQADRKHCSMECRRAHVWRVDSELTAITRVLTEARRELARIERDVSRDCLVCGTPVPANELRSRQHRRCTSCEAMRGRERRRAYRMRNAPPRLPEGVTYRALRDAQGNLCADCGQPEIVPRLDSPTGRVRPLAIAREGRGTNPRLVCMACRGFPAE